MQFADTPIGCSEFGSPAGSYSASLTPHRAAWLFELAGGAIADFENTCVPKSQREAAFTVAALHQWEMGTDDPRCVQAAENVSDLSREANFLTGNINAACSVDSGDAEAGVDRWTIPKRESSFPNALPPI